MLARVVAGDNGLFYLLLLSSFLLLLSADAVLICYVLSLLKLARQRTYCTALCTALMHCTSAPTALHCTSAPTDALSSATYSYSYEYEYSYRILPPWYSTVPYYEYGGR